MAYEDLGVHEGGQLGGSCMIVWMREDGRDGEERTGHMFWRQNQ